MWGSMFQLAEYPVLMCYVKWHVIIIADESTLACYGGTPFKMHTPPCVRCFLNVPQGVCGIQIDLPKV